MSLSFLPPQQIQQQQPQMQAQRASVMSAASHVGHHHGPPPPSSPARQSVTPPPPLHAGVAGQHNNPVAGGPGVTTAGAHHHHQQQQQQQQHQPSNMLMQHHAQQQQHHPHSAGMTHNKMHQHHSGHYHAAMHPHPPQQGPSGSAQQQQQLHQNSSAGVGPTAHQIQQQHTAHPAPHNIAHPHQQHHQQQQQQRVPVPHHQTHQGAHQQQQQQQHQQAANIPTPQQLHDESSMASSVMSHHHHNHPSVSVSNTNTRIAPIQHSSIDQQTPQDHLHSHSNQQQQQHQSHASQQHLHLISSHPSTQPSHHSVHQHQPQQPSGADSQPPQQQVQAQSIRQPAPVQQLQQPPASSSTSSTTSGDQQPTVTPHDVAAAFAFQYYRMLTARPYEAHKFYVEDSQMTRGSTLMQTWQFSRICGMTSIDETLRTATRGMKQALLHAVEGQASVNGSILVLIMGVLLFEENKRRPFCHTVFLAPQNSNLGQPCFFVLNDLFIYNEGSPPEENNNTTNTQQQAAAAATSTVAPPTTVPQQQNQTSSQFSTVSPSPVSPIATSAAMMSNATTSVEPSSAGHSSHLSTPSAPPPAEKIVKDMSMSTATGSLRHQAPASGVEQTHGGAAPSQADATGTDQQQMMMHHQNPLVQQQQQQQQNVPSGKLSSVSAGSDLILPPYTTAGATGGKDASQEKGAYIPSSPQTATDDTEDAAAEGAAAGRHVSDESDLPSKHEAQQISSADAVGTGNAERYDEGVQGASSGGKAGSGEDSIEAAADISQAGHEGSDLCLDVAGAMTPPARDDGDDGASAGVSPEAPGTGSTSQPRVNAWGHVMEPKAALPGSGPSLMESANAAELSRKKGANFTGEAKAVGAGESMDHHPSPSVDAASHQKSADGQFGVSGMTGQQQLQGSPVTQSRPDPASYAEKSYAGKLLRHSAGSDVAAQRVGYVYHREMSQQQSSDAMNTGGSGGQRQQSGGSSQGKVIWVNHIPRDTSDEHIKKAISRTLKGEISEGHVENIVRLRSGAAHIQLDSELCVDSLVQKGLHLNGVRVVVERARGGLGSGGGGGGDRRDVRENSGERTRRGERTTRRGGRGGGARDERGEREGGRGGEAQQSGATGEFDRRDNDNQQHGGYRGGEYWSAGGQQRSGERGDRGRPSSARGNWRSGGRGRGGARGAGDRAGGYGGDVSFPEQQQQNHTEVLSGGDDEGWIDASRKRDRVNRSERRGGGGRAVGGGLGGAAGAPVAIAANGW